jgi:hypothetical protein
MVSGERVLQVAQLLFLENCCLICLHQEGLDSLQDQWTDVVDLQTLVREQGQMIESLCDWVSVLECQERRRRSRGSQSTVSFHSLGLPVLLGQGSPEDLFTLEEEGKLVLEEELVAGPAPCEEVGEEVIEIEEEEVPIPIPPPVCHQVTIEDRAAADIEVIRGVRRHLSRIVIWSPSIPRLLLPLANR